jgi:hypothetical protein
MSLASSSQSKQCFTPHNAHVSNKLRSLDFGSMKFFNVSFLLRNFNGDILFERLPIRHPMGYSRQMQVIDVKCNGHVWCKMKTTSIRNYISIGFKTTKCLAICTIKTILVACLCDMVLKMKLPKLAIRLNFLYQLVCHKTFSLHHFL